MAYYSGSTPICQQENSFFENISMPPSDPGRGHENLAGDPLPEARPSSLWFQHKILAFQIEREGW